MWLPTALALNRNVDHTKQCISVPSTARILHQYADYPFQRTKQVISQIATQIATQIQYANTETCYFSTGTGHSEEN